MNTLNRPSGLDKSNPISPVTDIDDETIDKLSLKEAGEFLKKHNITIDKTGITKLTELKCAIKLQIAKLKGQTVQNSASMVLLQLKKEDEIRSEGLRVIADSIYEETKRVVDSSKSIKEQLNINLPNFQEKMKEHLNELNHPYCPVLVIGESSAGKSSFINLLLGDELLPCYHLSNTSVICEISYSQKYRATIYPVEGDTVTTIDEDTLNVSDPSEIKKEFVETLARFIQETEKRDTWKYKRAEIGIPCEVLKTGLCIVDSPGIGENAELTQTVLKYMFTSFAFVYIINSMNAGGLQEDRLQSIVRELVEERKKETTSHFLPQAAMFICNKWDQVSTEDRIPVMAETVRKLLNIWPSFHEDQVYRLSTKDSTFLMVNGYSSNRLMNILKGLKTMIPYGLEGRLTSAFSYFQFLVQRVKKSSSTYMKQTKLTVEERKQLIEDTEERLKKMKQESEDFFKNHRLALESNKDDTISKIKEHFKQVEVTTKLCQWSTGDVPKFQTWKEVELSIRAKTYERITREMTSFEEMHGLFRNKRQSMLDDFRKTFMLLEKKLLTIESLMTDDDSVYMPRDDFVHEPKDENPILSILGFSQWSRGKKILLGVSSPIIAPVAIVGLILSLPVLGIMKVRESIMVYKIKSNTQDYNNNPCEFMSKYSREILNKFLTDSNLKTFVKEELKVVYDFLDQLQQAEVKQRDSDVYLLDKLKNEIDRDDIDYAHHEKQFIKFSEYGDKLKWFKVTKLLRSDTDFIDSQTVDAPLESVSINKQETICSGFKAVIYKGTFRPDSQTTKSVAIRKVNIPISYLNVSDYLKEERSYRFAERRSYIIDLLTVTKDLNEVFQVFDGLASSLRQYTPGKKQLLNSIDWKGFITDVARSVISGLIYLHTKNLVHLDLSQDTIAVTDHGLIKLTNMSLPKVLDKLSCQDLLGDIKPYTVYLPLEVVVGGSKYSHHSDIYSYALLLWELCTGETAFHDMITEPDKHINTGREFFNCLGQITVHEWLHVNHKDCISKTWKYMITNGLQEDTDIRLSSKSMCAALNEGTGTE